MIATLMAAPSRAKVFDLNEKFTFGQCVAEIIYQKRLKPAHAANLIIMDNGQPMTPQQLHSITTDWKRREADGSVSIPRRATVIRIADGLEWDRNQALERAGLLPKAPMFYMTSQEIYESEQGKERDKLPSELSQMEAIKKQLSEALRTIEQLERQHKSEE